MITGVGVKCSMLHEHFSATPEATGGHGREGFHREEGSHLRRQGVHGGRWLPGGR
jgi:hypothetical protein